MEKIPWCLPFNKSSKISIEDLHLCKKMTHTSSKKNTIIKKLQSLWKKYDLGVVLHVLYRQQLNSGFILSNPLNDAKNEREKHFYDPVTQVWFLAQWNPERELRKKSLIIN